MGILSASGRPMVELGGQNCWKQFVKGDVVVSLQWLDIGDKEGKSPCMALFPMIRRMDSGSFVIPQEKAHEYATSYGNPTAQLFSSAFKGAVAMGFQPEKMLVHRIVDAIVEALPDLIRMPTAAPTMLERQKLLKGIELTAKLNDRVISEQLI